MPSGGDGIGLRLGSAPTAASKDGPEAVLEFVDES
jgi:hypothetical protein